MRGILMSIFVFYFLQSIDAQVNTFHEIIGDADQTEILACTAPLPNGDILAGGQASVNNITGRGWLALFGPLGQMKWSVLVDVPGMPTEIVSDIQQLSDGGWVALVHGTETPSANVSSSVVIRFDPANPIVQQAVKISGVANGYKRLCITPYGMVLTGWVWKQPGESKVPAVLQMDNQLNLQWQQVLYTASGTGQLEGSFFQTGAGLVYAVGTLNGNGLIAQCNQAGDVLWKTIGTADPDELQAIAPARNGTFLLGGSSRATGSERVWLTEINFNANSVQESWIYHLQDANGPLEVMDLTAIPGDQHALLVSREISNISARAMVWRLSSAHEVSHTADFSEKSVAALLQRVRFQNGRFVMAGIRVDQFGASGLLLQTGIDFTMNQDCCPAAVAIGTRVDVRTNVTLQNSSSAQGAPVCTVGVVSVESMPFMPAQQSACQPIPLQITLSEETICPGEAVIVTTGPAQPGITYALDFQNGTPAPGRPDSVFFSNNGFVLLTGENAFCTKTTSAAVMVGTAADEMPNAFTPNGDQVNDVFRPIFPCPVRNMRLRVYNRWGQLVFETNEVQGGWDGRINGVEAPMEVYGWQLEYGADRPDGLGVYKKQGSVTLIR
jgi:gliding motility-associated-like protein